MHCTNCGTQMSDNSKFCPSCGKGVDGTIVDSENKESSVDKKAGVPTWVGLVVIFGMFGFVAMGFSSINESSSSDSIREANASISQAAPANVPATAKTVDLATVLSSSQVDCVSLNPNNSTTNERFIFSYDNTLVWSSTRMDPLVGNYSIDGRVVSVAMTSFNPTQYMKWDVSDYSSESLNFTMITKLHKRPNKCRITAL